MVVRRRLLADINTINMGKKTPVKVHIWATKHKGNDVWKVAIDGIGGGPLTELKERYTRKSTAKIGALRNLKAIQGKMELAKGYVVPVQRWVTRDGRCVEFIYAKPAKK